MENANLWCLVHFTYFRYSNTTLIIRVHRALHKFYGSFMGYYSTGYSDKKTDYNASIPIMFGFVSLLLCFHVVPSLIYFPNNFGYLL